MSCRSLRRGSEEAAQIKISMATEEQNEQKEKDNVWGVGAGIFSLRPIHASSSLQGKLDGDDEGELKESDFFTATRFKQLAAGIRKKTERKKVGEDGTSFDRVFRIGVEEGPQGEKGKGEWVKKEGS